VHSPHPQRLVHRTATASKSSNRLRLAADRFNHPRAGSPKTRGQALKRPGPVTLSFLGTAGSFHKEACGIERRPPERRGPARHPEWKAGTDHRPVVADHGDGNTGRIPFRTAVGGGGGGEGGGGGGGGGGGDGKQTATPPPPPPATLPPVRQLQQLSLTRRPVHGAAAEQVAPLLIPEFPQRVAGLLENLRQRRTVDFFSGMNGNGDLPTVWVSPDTVTATLMTILGPSTFPKKREYVLQLRHKETA
jgi:hypothetical protein